MAVKWKSAKPGIRYYTHATRKHGVGPDKYFAIRAQVKGKRHEEGVGWASEGWKVAKVADLLAKLKSNHLTGEGPQTLKEMREEAEAKRIAEEKQKRVEERENISFGDFFKDEYLPGTEATRKEETVRRQKEHVKIWIGPVTRDIPLKDLRLFHLEKIRSNMDKAGRAPRTMQYVMATFRAVWNHARNKGYVHEQSPTKALTLPKVNNQRRRYLTQNEADKLLAVLLKRSEQTHDIAFLSLMMGLRFSEVAGLTWGCVDMNREVIDIFNGKGDKDRTLPMNAEVKSFFEAKRFGPLNELIFLSRVGKRIGKISKTYDNAVNELSLNDNLSDGKQKVVFHTLRHTHASWLVEAGVDLYVVQRLLGHSTPILTQRYAHVANDLLKNAVHKLDTEKEKNSDSTTMSPTDGKRSLFIA